MFWISIKLFLRNLLKANHVMKDANKVKDK
jgi:hypothetical protein